MVGRLSEQKRKLVVVDLDGTLVDGNTLRIYIRHLLRQASGGMRLKIVTFLAARMLRLISHRKMKFGVLDAVPHDKATLSQFAEDIKRRLNPTVVSLLDRYRKQGATILLATAAPDIYIPYIWDCDYVATQTVGNKVRLECRGSEKLRVVNEFIGKTFTFEAFITDHHDDLPLLEAGAAVNYLVKPSAKTRRILEEHRISYRTI